MTLSVQMRRPFVIVNDDAGIIARGLDVLNRIEIGQAEAAGIFDTRAEYTAWAATNTVVAGSTYWVGGLPFLGQIGATVTGLTGLVPHPKNPVTPDHFSENTIPGTTDMTTAINAACDYSLQVMLLGEDYLVSGTISLYGSNAKLYGQGQPVSKILCATNNIDIITLDGPGTQVLSVEVSGIMLAYTAGTKTGGAHIRGMKYLRWAKFDDLFIRNVYDAFRFNGIFQAFFTRIFSDQFGLTSGTKGRYFFNFDAVTEGVAHSDIHVITCNLGAFAPSGGFGLEAWMRLNTCDGIYIDNSHFLKAERFLIANPTGGAVDNIVASITISNSYLDHARYGHIQLLGSAAIYQNILLSNTHVRLADECTTGLIEISADCKGIIVSGGSVRLSSARGIYTNPANIVKNVVIGGTVFADNNSANNAAYGDIELSATGGTITGLSFEGGGAAGVAIRLTAASSGIITSANSHINSTAGAEYVNSGTENWVDGHDIGTNANGEYCRSKAGWMTCTRRMNSAASGDTTWTYPYPFKAATVPVIGFGMALSGASYRIGNANGAPTATAVNFRAVEGTTHTQVLTSVMLTATGRWK
jgi:hypothetical protein